MTSIVLYILFYIFLFSIQISQNIYFPFFLFLFSVLQECATDSEELIYPIRPPSTCSAPPDLLLTGDREPIGSRVMSHNHHHAHKDGKIRTKTKSVENGIESEKILLEV